MQMKMKCLPLLLLSILLMPSQSLQVFGDVLLPPRHTEQTPSRQQPDTKRYSTYAIAFYNVENLFDTIDDPRINDQDFLPDGMYGWTSAKYEAKIRNMSNVLAEIAVDKGLQQGPAVIGLAEVENRQVCMDLLHSRALRNRGYRVLHYDSPDKRGIDCAMLYNPRLFRLEDSLYIQCITPQAGSDDWLGFRQDPNTHRITARPLFGDKSHPTRGFLVGIGTMAGEKMAIIVCHWPSRGAESYVRERAARQVKQLVEALQKQYQGIKVVVMGDLNDDPNNKSLTKGMQCKTRPSEIKSETDIFNPWYHMLYDLKQGTLYYNGEWNLFDQILLTGNMVDRRMRLGKNKPKISNINLSKGLTYYYCEVFKRDYMETPDGKYQGSPLRTHSGGVWQNGYSDHFPTCIYLIKAK